MRLLKGLSAACSSIALMVFALAPSASAEPIEFAPFSKCPYTNAEITDCFLATSSGGTLAVGTRSIPLVNPITLQGGFFGEAPETQFYGANNGDTLSKTPQPVPGGLVGATAPTSWPEWLQKWFNQQIEEGFTGVTATAELAGSSKGLTEIQLNTENLLFEEGAALVLPVKIRLSSAILGSNCLIGSDTEPVELELSTGASGSLNGSAGYIEFNEEFTITTLTGTKLVDETFAAPGVDGCGGLFSSYVDPFVDSLFGLPAGGGENSAVMTANIRDAVATEVDAFFT
jgi:hypothetical protein